MILSLIYWKKDSAPTTNNTFFKNKERAKFIERAKLAGGCEEEEERSFDLLFASLEIRENKKKAEINRRWLHLPVLTQANRLNHHQIRTTAMQLHTHQPLRWPICTIR